MFVFLRSKCSGNPFGRPQYPVLSLNFTFTFLQRKCLYFTFSLFTTSLFFFYISLTPLTKDSVLLQIWNFHVLSNLLLTYICKLHWNLGVYPPTTATASNSTFSICPMAIDWCIRYGWFFVIQTCTQLNRNFQTQTLNTEPIHTHTVEESTCLVPTLTLCW